MQPTFMDVCAAPCICSLQLAGKMQLVIFVWNKKPKLIVKFIIFIQVWKKCDFCKTKNHFSLIKKWFKKCFFLVQSF